METRTEYRTDALTQSDLDEGLALLKGEPNIPTATQEELDTIFMLFLRWEHATRDTIDFKKIYVDMAGDLIAGLLLSQIVYWYLIPDEGGNSKLRVYRNGHQWIAKQRDEWYDEIRISAKQYDRAVSILEERGLVHTDNFRFDGMRTAHVRLDESAFMQTWQREIKLQKVPVLPKGQDRSLPKGKTEITQRSRPLTETTTEITTEIHKESRASAAHTLTPLVIEDDYTRTYYVKDRELVTTIGKASTGPWRVECDTCGGSVTIKAIGELVACRCGMHEFVLTDARPAPVKDSSAVLASARAAPGPNGNGRSSSRPRRREPEESAMLQALAAATRIDLSILPKSRRAQLQAEANRIEQGGYTITEVTAAGVHWWQSDWRGKKGSPPTDTQFTELLGRLRNGKDKAIEDEWADCIGRPETTIF